MTVRSSTLVRLGFADATAALATVERLGAQDLVAFFGRVGDPDLALRALSDLAEVSTDDLIEELVNDEGTAMRLLSVLGASRALGEHLVKHPTHWRALTDGRLGSTRPTAAALRAELLTAVGADPGADAPVASVDNPDDVLRVAYRRLLVPLAARDLAHALALEDTAAELSDLACATVEAAVAIARTRVDVGSLRFAVIALGKTGGHELNYVSDVDVVFVHAAGPD
ncbi:MAG TPA: bifunctional glutamine-synthetase adenylyltransferase/deadenyltransferase, partial [Nocardioides sp.]|nr:bifunctional glutamine-synthetase adenylyltransferase/deadenyltransferase [Nocardioides sp.]